MVDLKKLENKDLIGYFWLPGSEDTKIQGQFIFNETNILIKLSQSFPWQNFETLPDGSKRKTGDMIETFKVIFGQVEEIGKLTIFNGYEKTNSMNWVKEGPLFEKKIIESNDFFAGKHFESMDRIEFDKISFSITEINNWASNICGFKYSLSVEKNEFKEFTLSYSYPQKEEFKINKIDKILSFEPNFNQNISRNRKDSQFKENINLCLIPTVNKLLFEETIQQIYTLRDLFSLLINDNLLISNIVLKEQDLKTKKYQDYCYYFSTKINLDKKKVKEDYEMIFLFSDLKIDFQVILDNWFDFQEAHKHIITEFVLTNMHSKGLIMTFLSYCKILESLHRNIDESVPLENDVITRINNEIKDKILTGYDENINKKYLESLNWVNTFNLQERLDILLSKYVDDDLKKQLGIDETFNKRIKQIRNDLTHLNKKVENLDFKEVYSLTKKLKFIIYIIIFKSLSINEDLILRKLKDGWVSRYYL